MNVKFVNSTFILAGSSGSELNLNIYIRKTLNLKQNEAVSTCFAISVRMFSSDHCLLLKNKQKIDYKNL